MKIKYICECGKFKKCCRKINISFSGKISVEPIQHLRCGKVEKQLLNIKEWWEKR